MALGMVLVKLSLLWLFLQDQILLTDSISIVTDKYSVYSMEGSTINMTSTYFGLDGTFCRGLLVCIHPYHNKFDIVSSCTDFQILNTTERDTGFYWFEKTKMIHQLKLKINNMRCPPDYVCAIEGSSIILKFSIEGFVYYSTFKQGPYSKNKLIFRNFTKKLDLHIFNVSYIDEGIYRYIMKEFVWVKLKVANLWFTNQTYLSTIVGQEGEEMEVNCTSQTAQYNTALMIKTKGTVKAIGDKQSVSYLFIPDKTDNLTTYTCVDSTHSSIMIEVTLFIRYATTPSRNLGTTSNVEDIINSAKGLLSKDITVYFILSLFVMGFGIGFCIVLFKNKTLTKQKKTIITQSQDPAIPQNGNNIEMENDVYDIIDESHMLDDQHVQQMEMSPVYLDVIDDSYIRESGEMKTNDKHENPCQIISTAQTHTIENDSEVDCLSLISSDSNSSSDEFEQDSSQDNLNPYQTMIQSEISPPEVSEYLTLAPDNRDDSTSSSGEFIQDSTQDYLNPYQSMIQSEISPPEVLEYLTLAPYNRDDSTSSSGEFIQDSTQDYLNPYQSMIQSEISPPEVSEYLTLAPDNCDNSTSSSDEFIQDSTQDYLNRYQSMIQSEISPSEVSEYLTLALDNSRIESGMLNYQKSHKQSAASAKRREPYGEDIRKCVTSSLP